MKKMKKMGVFFIFICLMLSLPKHILAQDEFLTDYELAYTVNLDTSVDVTQKVTLTNKLANVYAAQYQLVLGTTKISQIRAWDSLGSLETQIDKRPNATAINLKLNEQKIGKGEKNVFNLAYQSADYAQRSGQILEIGFPKINNQEDLANLSVIVKVPQAFSQPIYILPVPQKEEQNEVFFIYYFSKSELKDRSITASFGQTQFFDFNLTYYLKNNTQSPFFENIALPPDTPFQKIYLNTLIPPPENITIDDDGNWLAKYFLPKNSEISVIATGSAEIFLKPKTEIMAQPLSNQSLYLRPLQFWESDDEEIKKLALELKTVKNIYDYTVSNLTYDYEKIGQAPERLGALKTLANKNSVVCQEFTDLFIALCRAAGIPSRAVSGFAYTKNPELRPLSLVKDILHAWPEYYDDKDKLWRAVDPTWENTTGGVDFFTQPSLNHLSFVFHGLSSAEPLSPGAYRNEKDDKVVIAAFGSQPQRLEKYDFYFTFPKKIYSGFKIEGKIIIVNKGNVALYDDEIGAIPPFSRTVKTIYLPKTSVFARGPINFTYQFKNAKKTWEGQLISPFYAYVLPYGSGLILGLSLFVLLLKKLNKLKNR